MGADLARSAVQDRGLLRDHFEIARLVPGDVAAVEALGDLAFANGAHGGGEHPRASGVIELHRHVERQRVDVVAEQHRHFVAVKLVEGRLLASHLR